VSKRTLAQLASSALPPGEATGRDLLNTRGRLRRRDRAADQQWENAPQPAIVFTGYIPPGSPADRLVKSGRAKFLRWNVHPRLSDNIAQLGATGAATVIPAFCDSKFLPRCRPR
jgi:hypothetical protein